MAWPALVAGDKIASETQRNDQRPTADCRTSLENRRAKEDWGEISRIEGGECSKRVANTFLICCLLDFQSPTDEAWRKAERLVERLGDPADLWSTISSFAKEKWDSKYDEVSLTAFATGTTPMPGKSGQAGLRLKSFFISGAWEREIKYPG